MTGKQHLSFGIITGIAFSAYLHKLNICQNNADMVFVVCGSVLGSLLPDIDSTESIISNILLHLRHWYPKSSITYLDTEVFCITLYSGLLWHFLRQIIIILRKDYSLVFLDIYFLMPVLTKVYLHCHGSSIEINHSMCFPKSGGCM